MYNSCNWVNEEVDVKCISMVINKTKAKKKKQYNSPVIDII